MCATRIVKITFIHKSILFYDRVHLIFIATLTASEENSLYGLGSRGELNVSRFNCKIKCQCGVEVTDEFLKPLENTF